MAQHDSKTEQETFYIEPASEPNGCDARFADEYKLRRQ
jgi:hypothetical protein